MMAADLRLVEIIAKTSLGRRLKQLVLTKGGKLLAKRWRQVAVAGSERLALRMQEVALLAGVLAKRAAELLPGFQRRYGFLHGFSPQSFAEAVSMVAMVDRRSYASLRGIVVERFIPDMPEMGVLLGELTALARKTDKKWSPPRLVSGARTPDGREIADWMIVAEHPDGRVWVMAVIESKSISNTEDLVNHRGSGPGQHLWDYLRAKSDGLKLEKATGSGVVETVIPPAKLVMEPKPMVKNPRPGLYTRFIGVTPKKSKFTASQLKSLAAQGVDIERWDWPIDENELLRMIHDLETELRVIDVAP